MKLHQLDSGGANLVQSNKSGGFTVNDQHYKRSIVVSADKIIDDWSPQYFDDLKISDFQRLAEFDAEIVILGTGKTLRMPSPELLQPIRQQKCGFEAMDSDAACGTYNVLVGDGRNTVVALLLKSEA